MLPSFEILTSAKISLKVVKNNWLLLSLFSLRMLFIGMFIAARIMTF